MLKFKSSEKSRIKIIIDENFSYIIENKKDIPIVGLKEETENIVKLELLNSKNEKVKEGTISIKTEKLEENYPEIETKIYDEPFSDNFIMLDIYCVEQENFSGYISVIDRAGNTRLVINDVTYAKSLKNGNLLTSLPMKLRQDTISHEGFMEIDLLGKVINIYETEYEIHHDFAELPNGNIIFLADGKNQNEYIEDGLIEVNRKTGKVEKYLDFKDILDKDRIGLLEYSKKDWFHGNSLEYIEEDNSILVSSRHQSAIIKMSLTDNKIEYIIGDHYNWNEKYKDKLLNPDDTVEWTYGNHSASILKNGNVLIFDNGNYRSLIDEEKIDAKDNYSRAVIYSLDTGNNTISQVWQYGKERGSQLYSNYVGSAKELENGNILVNFGGIVKDKDGKALDGRGFSKDLGTYQTAYIVEIDPKTNKIIWEMNFKDNERKRSHINYRAKIFRFF